MATVEKPELCSTSNDDAEYFESKDGLSLLKIETIFSSDMGYDSREFRYSTTVNQGMITLSDPDKVVAHCVTTGETKELPITTQANIVATRTKVIYFPDNPWSTIRIVALNDPNTILGEAAHETAVIWLLWTPDQTAIVYCLANCDIYRWDQASVQPELVLTPMREIQQARTSLQVHVSDDERWWAVVGATIVEEEKEILDDAGYHTSSEVIMTSAEGYVQCYDALTGGSRIYPGLSCTVAKTTIGDLSMDLLVIADNRPDDKMSLHIFQPDRHWPVPSFNPVLVEVPYPKGADYPVGILIHEHLPVVYVATNNRFILVFELFTGTLLDSHLVRSKDSHFQFCLDGRSICFETEEGKIMRAEVDEKILVQWLSQMMKDKDLATSIASCIGFPN